MSLGKIRVLSLGGILVSSVVTEALGLLDQQYARPRSKGVIRCMILKVCDSLADLAMKMKDMQTGKGRGDAPLSLTVIKEKLIVCKASCTPITAFSKIFDMD